MIIFNSGYSLQPNPASYMQPSWITQQITPQQFLSRLCPRAGRGKSILSIAVHVELSEVPSI